ncbi:MAG: LPS assembly protein LptD [Deltaproteobacteria bacterium]|nr:LPS assembly protein LptD [Deltaproteobacteria bacterium]
MAAAQGEWRIEAGTISYDQEEGVYEAQDNVRIYTGDRFMRADWARLHVDERKADLRGGVFLQYGRDWLKGDRVEWKLDEETGWVDGGMVFFAENHFYVMGESISKTGQRTYELKNGFLTSCEPDHADWKVRYGRMDIDLDGFAWARDTSFVIRDTPVFFSPIAGLPVQKRRQSGFLVPYGAFTKLSGFEGELPFYWAIRQDMDATFFLNPMTERGVMGGVEYRIAHETWGEGIWNFNYLRDQVSKDHLAERGFSYIKDDRYWLRARHSVDLPHAVHTFLDLDFASDQNYLKEFTKGSKAFGYSSKMFREFFGRGILSDKTILARESSLYMEKDTESTALSMDARYWDQLNRSLEDITLQRLPSLAFNVVPTGFRDLPLYYTLNSSWVHYWRRDDDRGGRLDAMPKLHFPLHIKNYLDIEPSVGIRGTSYIVDWESEDRDAWQGRFSSQMRLEMSSRLNRVYNVQWGDVSALQHSIRPELVYEFIPDNSKGETPSFDRFDGNLKRHYVRAGLTNFLTARETRADEAGETVTIYRELARMQLFQLYNIERPIDRLPDLRFGPRPEFVGDDVEGFANLGFRLDVMPRRYVTLSYSADYSPERREATQQDVFLTLESGRGHAIRFDYQFRNDLKVNEFITETSIKILPGLYVGTYHDYSIDRDTLFKHGYALRYLSGCWAVGVSFEKEGEDQRVAFSVDLLGLGSLGSGARRLGGVLDVNR